MPPDRNAEDPTAVSRQVPDDRFLVSSMLGGDEAALDKLIDRYDRLVRYTILKQSRTQCARDPQWLDSVASDTWSGFVQAVRRTPDNLPQSVRAYLVRIARNRCVSATRRGNAGVAVRATGGDEAQAEIEAKDGDPSELLSSVEMLEALRGCVAELDPSSRRLAGELRAITDRRWKHAAGALGMSESTLRSRWKNVLEQLRRCVAGKTGERLAPRDSESDY